MAYRNFSDAQVIALVHDLRQREYVATFRDYLKEVNDLRSLKDDVITLIPEEYRKMLGNDGDHEGGMVLDHHMNLLAEWFNRLELQVTVRPGSISEFDDRKAAAQATFAQAAENMFAEGSPLANYRQQVSQDLARAGVAVVRQHPRQSYYTRVPQTPLLSDVGGANFMPNPNFREDDVDEDGARTRDSFPFVETAEALEARRNEFYSNTSVRDIWTKERVVLEGWFWEPALDGEFSASGEEATRTLGHLAQEVGVEEARRAFGIYDFGPQVKPESVESWHGVTITTLEVWLGDMGYLIALSGPGIDRSRKRDKDGVILARWVNQMGKPPYYPRMSRPWPWQSPIDLAVSLTQERNFWATMKRAQAVQRIFESPQAVEPPAQDPEFATRREPMQLENDPLRRPSLPDGAQWVPPPGQFIAEIFQEYAEVVRQHESALAAVRRLMGEEVGEHTAVGTADQIEEMAQRPFHGAIESIGNGWTIEWRDFFRWMRTFHSGREVYVNAIRKPRPGVLEASRNIAHVLSGADIVSENVIVRLRPKSLINEVALFNMATEGIANRMFSYEHAVDQGWVPGVDDANWSKRQMFVGTLREGMAQNWMDHILTQHKRALQGLSVQGEPGSGLVDQFGNPLRPADGEDGFAQGPLNIENSPLAAQSTRALRAPAPAAGPGG